MSIPSILVFKDGKLVAQKTGALPKVMLKAFVDSVK
jgi:thioredoxin 1